MAKDKKENDTPTVGDAVTNENTGPVTDEDAANTGAVDSADTPTTAAQDAAVKAAVSDEKPLQPGDDGYSPFTDPVIPSSALAEVVAVELASGKKGKSPTREALVEAAKQ